MKDAGYGRLGAYAFPYFHFPLVGGILDFVYTGRDGYIDLS